MVKKSQNSLKIFLNITNIQFKNLKIGIYGKRIPLFFLRGGEGGGVAMVKKFTTKQKNPYL
jgi:hypothetical protein